MDNDAFVRMGKCIRCIGNPFVFVFSLGDCQRKSGVDKILFNGIRSCSVWLDALVDISKNGIF